MKKWQDPQQSVIWSYLKDLRHPFYVGVEIEVGQHDSFRVACAPTTEDDGRQIIHGGAASGPRDSLQQRNRGEHSQE